MPPKKGPARLFKLPRLLDHSPDPIAIINDQFEVVYANSACCQWLGTSQDDLLGTHVRYSSAGASKDDRNNGICPPPELFSTAPHVVGQIHVLRDGKRIFRNATFNRIRSEDDGYQAAMVVAGAADCEPTELPSGDRSWHELLAKMKQTESSIYRVENLVGSSDQAKMIRRQVAAASGNQADCLVIGPVGSGREQVARTIFAERRLKNSQLVPIHCSIADSESIQSAIKNWVFDRRSNQSSDWLLLLDVDQLGIDAQSELLGYTKLPDFQMPIIATASEDLMYLASVERYSKSLAMHLSTQSITLLPLSQRK